MKNPIKSQIICDVESGLNKNKDLLELNSETAASI